MRRVTKPAAGTRCPWPWVTGSLASSWRSSFASGPLVAQSTGNAPLWGTCCQGFSESSWLVASCSAEPARRTVSASTSTACCGCRQSTPPLCSAKPWRRRCEAKQGRAENEHTPVSQLARSLRAGYINDLDIIHVQWGLLLQQPLLGSEEKCKYIHMGLEFLTNLTFGPIIFSFLFATKMNALIARSSVVHTQ